MKKFLLLSMLTAAMMTSCGSDEFTYYQPEEKEYGKINLDVTSDVSISTATRADDSFTTSDFNYTVTQSTNSYGPYSYDQLTTSQFVVGSGYAVYAENCTEVEAETGRGQQRLTGKSESFSITKDNTTNVALSCTTVNSKVVVTIDDTFTSLIKDASIKVGYDGRMVEFDDTNTTAFFKAGQKLSYNISGKNNNGTTKTYNAELGITTAAKTQYNVTLKATESKGQISISFSVDSTLNEGENKEINVDPYANE